MIIIDIIFIHGLINKIFFFPLKKNILNFAIKRIKPTYI